MTSTTALLPKWIEVLVPETEKSLYQAKLENPILTIPDDRCGLGEVRNWCLDHFKEETLIMVDDDITRAYCLSDALSRRIRDPEEICQVIINCAVMAKDSGAKVFGFAQKDIRAYCPAEPFSLNGWVGCIIGVIGRDFRFRDDKFKVDIDYCMKNLLVNRYVWIDGRYYFSQGRDNNKGGNSRWRTEEAYAQSLESLLKRWSPWLRKRELKGQVSLTNCVKRRQVLKI